MKKRVSQTFSPGRKCSGFFFSMQTTTEHLNNLKFAEQERRVAEAQAHRQRAVSILEKLNYPQVCGFVARHIKSKRGAAIVLDTLYALHLTDPERTVLYDDYMLMEGTVWMRRSATQWREEYGIANVRQLMTAYRAAKLFLDHCCSLYKVPREDYFVIRFDVLTERLNSDPVVQAILRV